MPDEETQEIEIRGRRVPTVKAHFIDRDGTERSTAMSAPEASEDLWDQTQTISPPIDPRELAFLFDVSGALRTNIDTLATNVDGYGHDFEPVIDLDDVDTAELIRQALLEERMHQATADDDGEVDTAKAAALLKILKAKVLRLADDGDTGTPEDDAEDLDIDVEVTDAEVEEKIEELRRTMIWERQKLQHFFDYVSVDHSFVKLRGIMRQDLEQLGNAYWEVLRNQAGEPTQFVYVPGFTVRLMHADKEPTQVTMPVPRTLLRVTDEPVYRRFRRYLQIVPGQGKTYFKDFGDPRVYSSKTGKPYKDEKVLEKAEPGVLPANELVHFKVHSSSSAYGTPRWIAELLAVLGNRHAEEINLAYFENKSIPPMAILVSGGHLTADDVAALKDYMKNEIRGKRNFHKIMVLQAEPFGDALSGANSGSVKIEIKPLTDTQHDDGLFMKYQEANGDRIGGVFRIPRLLRGDVRDFNRATAQASLEFAEQQVFSPIRMDFDWWVNRFILPALGVRLHKFRSRGPETTDMQILAEMLAGAAKAGYLSITELRDIAERVFGRKLRAPEDIDEAEVPLELLRLGVAGNEDGLDDGEPLPEDPEEDTPEQAAKRAIRRRKQRRALNLLSIESQLREFAREQAHSAFAEAKALEGEV